ncbi:MAG: TlpA family protein disulfide reductase [Kribbellaceae bacterium]
MRIRTTPTVSVLIASLAAAVGLAGCGGGDSAVREQRPQTSAPSTSTAASTPPSTAASTPARTPPATGQLAFKGTTLDGKPFDAATLAGKPVVLWFWAPWCPICKGQAPDVLDVHQQYAGRVSVVGVAGLDDQPNMQPFVDSTKTGDLTHLADPDGEIWQRFKVTQQSTYVLIDASGNVTFTGNVGGDELRSKVAALAG